MSDTILMTGVGSYLPKNKYSNHDLTKFIDANSSDIEAYLIRGTSKYNLEDYKGAIFDYTKVIEINPSHVEAHYNRSHSKYHLGDYKGAEEDTLKAQKIGLDDFSNLLK